MIENRSEILFIYDIANANPNGDPSDENKPRIDEESRRNIVTDVRLKRTVRDYLYEQKSQEIFVREIANDKGEIQDAKARAEDFLVKNGEAVDKKSIDFPEYKHLINEAILHQCIDVRLFGGTIPLEHNKKKGSITHTGAVQFKMGQSLHAVVLQHIKGTGAFASKAGQQQKTFREEYMLPYSLIAFHGIVNENAAKFTNLTDSDLELLKDALWNGTKSLISRSKVGQMPRLLLVVTYKQKNFHIGELDKYVKLASSKTDDALRDIVDFEFDVVPLIEVLEHYKEHIQQVEVAYDTRFAKQFTVPLVEQLQQKGIHVVHVER